MHEKVACAGRWIYNKHTERGIKEKWGSVGLKKFEGMLFCTDLDGTLYTDEKTVSSKNLDAIEYFKSEGGLFTFITGRVPKTAGEICRLIRPNAPYGCLNGGGIYDPWKEEYLWNAFLPAEAMQLVKAVDEQLPEIGIQLNTEKEIYFNKDNAALVWFRAVTGVPNIACHYEAVKDPVLKVVFAHEDETQVEAIEPLLKRHPQSERVDFIRSERTLYEILPKGVSKGNVLCKMAELLGIDVRKTIAAGDYNNDVSMLRMAGAGFAVANAIDAAKAAADYVTVSNNEDAIAVIIEGLDGGKFAL